MKSEPRDHAYLRLCKWSFWGIRRKRSSDRPHICNHSSTQADSRLSHRTHPRTNSIVLPGKTRMNTLKKLILSVYRPLTKLSEGVAFTYVCLFTGGGGLCPSGSLCPEGVSVTETPLYINNSGQYASYWNAFWSVNSFVMVVSEFFLKVKS